MCVGCCFSQHDFLHRAGVNTCTIHLAFPGKPHHIIMKIHEYQAKQILSESGVAVLKNQLATTPEEAADAFEKLEGDIAVVKAQIHAGGRGKGTLIEKPDQHGVQLVRSAKEARLVAENILGNKLVTIQTGPSGQTVRKVLVEQGCRIARELYLGIVLDRAKKQPVLMLSSEGGVEIEKVAAENPELIHKEHFDPHFGLQSFQVRKLCAKVGITGTSVRSADRFMRTLCKTYVQHDCSLVEINPLVITEEGDLVALDAKINFDDNALFRHPQIIEMRDKAEEDPSEVRAGDVGLSYVKLDGNIGCLVNGAGLAMSTMDIIKLHGGEPANFLDVGGGASAETVENGFRILLSDPNVQAILIKIFGGIVRCDRVAEGVIQARKNIDVNVPLVVRLAGTNADVAAEMLENSDMDFTVGHGLKDAAEKVAAAIQ